MKKGDIMADIQIIKGEVANTAARLSAGSTLVMVDELQRDEESTLTAVASAQTLYEDFSKVVNKLKEQVADDSAKLFKTDSLFAQWDSKTAKKFVGRHNRKTVK